MNVVDRERVLPKRPLLLGGLVLVCSKVEPPTHLHPANVSPPDVAGARAEICPACLEHLVSSASKVCPSGLPAICVRTQNAGRRIFLDASISRGYSHSMITTVTGKNQVTVPVAIANHADIHPGTRLDWEPGETKDTIIVHVLPDAATIASRLRGRGKAYKRRGGSAVRNLAREREREDRGRDA